MSHESLTPFPAARIIRHVIHQAGPPLPCGLEVVLARRGRDGTVDHQVFGTEQDLHATVLVACADLLDQRQTHHTARAVSLALTAERARAADAVRHAMARQRRFWINGALIAALSGVAAALAVGVLELLS